MKINFAGLLRSKTVIGGVIAGLPQVIEGYQNRDYAKLGAGVGIILGAVGVRTAIGKAAVGNPGGTVKHEPPEVEGA